MFNKMIAAFAFVAVMPSVSHACTVFAATGADMVKGGGTLISKVRDEHMNGQVVRTVCPKDGYCYRGLFAGKQERFNMGVNEKGFVIARTTAGSVPKKIRQESERFRTPDGLIGLEYLIRNCATVDEALKHSEIFSHEPPINYIMADAHKIAFIEVLPGGKYEIKVQDHGMLTHTNHYVLENSLTHNQIYGPSSHVRYDRINQLMTEAKKPFTLDQFIAFTEDRNDGPDNSIFRIGTPGTNRSTTLSTMSVYIPEKGHPQMRLKWRDDKNDPTSWQEERLTVQFKRD